MCIYEQGGLKGKQRHWECRRDVEKLQAYPIDTAFFPSAASRIHRVIIGNKKQKGIWYHMIMLILLRVPLTLENMLQASTQPSDWDRTASCTYKHWVFTITLQPKSWLSLQGLWNTARQNPERWPKGKRAAASLSVSSPQQAGDTLKLHAWVNCTEDLTPSSVDGVKSSVTQKICKTHKKKISKICFYMLHTKCIKQ